MQSDRESHRHLAFTFIFRERERKEGKKKQRNQKGTNKAPRKRKAQLKTNSRIKRAFFNLQGRGRFILGTQKEKEFSFASLYCPFVLPQPKPSFIYQLSSKGKVFLFCLIFFFYYHPFSSFDSLPHQISFSLQISFPSSSSSSSICMCSVIDQ